MLFQQKSKMSQKHEIKTRNATIHHGDRLNCDDNVLVGNIDDVGGIISSISDLLEITFEIDPNGILTVGICSSVTSPCKSKTFKQEEHRLS